MTYHNIFRNILFFVSESSYHCLPIYMYSLILEKENIYEEHERYDKNTDKM